MKKLENKKVIYYKTYSDDIVESKNQNYKIKDNYKWIHNNIFYRMFSCVLWKIAAIIVFIYYKLILHIKVENKEVIKKYKKQGYFVYGNHTQPVGDAFMPWFVVDKRFNTVASEANLGIPVLGKFLTMLAALIIPEKISQMKEFMKAVEYRIKQGRAIIIYPEAHVWPYYTNIRPFSDSAFKFPIINKVPSFCMTTTYYKRKNKSKPGIKIYVDGPFFPDVELSQKEQEKQLCKKIYDKMVERSKNSNFEYIEYKKESN